VIRALVVLAVALAVAPVAAAKPCGDQLQFGYIRSLVKTGGHYELRFDPALFTTGLTASTAAVEDGVIGKGDPMPNDNYVVNESKRTYLFRLSPTAHVTVLTPKRYLDGAPVSIGTLARLVAGKTPIALYEGLETGFWMRYHADTVCDLRQQYHP
jgi:hypothetical protein